MEAHVTLTAEDFYALVSGKTVEQHGERGLAVHFRVKIALQDIGYDAMFRCLLCAQFPEYAAAMRRSSALSP